MKHEDGHTDLHYFNTLYTVCKYSPCCQLSVRNSIQAVTYDTQYFNTVSTLRMETQLNVTQAVSHLAVCSHRWVGEPAMSSTPFKTVSIRLGQISRVAINFMRQKLPDS